MNIDNVNSEFSRHPNNFYRQEHQEAPLRQAPEISSQYSDIYLEYRKMILANTGYSIKESAESFKPYAHLVDRWMDAEWEGDFLGDRLALWMRQQPDNQGRKLFEQALEKGIESIENAPKELIDFFKQVDNVPELFDLQKVQRAADLLADLSPLMHYMANTSLIWVSSTVGPVSRMVGATGRFFDVENSLNRFVETSSYVVGDVSAADVFQRNSQSLKTGVRVRLMHSLIRNQVIKSQDPDIIDFARRGHPMSMHIGASGGFMFTFYCLAFSASMGKKYSLQDYEDCCELACLIAYVNGVDYDLLPKGLDEGCLYIDHSLSMCEGFTPFTADLNRAFYYGIPELIAKRQNSKLLALTSPISQKILCGINQWAYGKAIFEVMPGMPKRSSLVFGGFVIAKYLRMSWLLVDKGLPFYQQRLEKRRVKHRAFTNKKFVSFVAKLMKRSGSKEVAMTYDSHDNSTEKDLKSAK